MRGTKYQNPARRNGIEIFCIRAAYLNPLSSENFAPKTNNIPTIIIKAVLQEDGLNTIPLSRRYTPSENQKHPHFSGTKFPRKLLTSGHCASIFERTIETTYQPANTNTGYFVLTSHTSNGEIATRIIRDRKYHNGVTNGSANGYNPT